MFGGSGALVGGGGVVKVGLMVRVGLEGGRMIDEDVIEVEEKDAICL